VPFFKSASAILQSTENFGLHAAAAERNDFLFYFNDYGKFGAVFSEFNCTCKVYVQWCMFSKIALNSLPPTCQKLATLLLTQKARVSDKGTNK
jgi:hypothetical protein